MNVTIQAAQYTNHSLTDFGLHHPIIHILVTRQSKIDNFNGRLFRLCQKQEILSNRFCVCVCVCDNAVW